MNSVELRQKDRKHKNGDRTHKKNQSEIKNTLTEMKTTLQGSTVEWVKQRIKSEIWKIRKQKTPNQNSIKKELKTTRTVQGASETTSSTPTSAESGLQKEKRDMD